MPSSNAPPKNPIFTTMGMFIIDTIEPHSTQSNSTPQIIQDNIIGGGGTFATLGARIIATSAHASAISWIIDEGSDLIPREIHEYLDSWSTDLRWRYDANRLTTRGWNGYVDVLGTREFRYLTPKKQITIDDLKDQGLLGARSFHLICSPMRVQEIVKLIRDHADRSDTEQPVIAWEPVPDFCGHEYLDQVLQALPMIDIFTPNAEEAARLLSQTEPTTTESLLQLSQYYTQCLSRDNSMIVLRCGALGCHTATINKDESSWFPAYHQLTPEKVIDPTGGGNTFIGSFLMGFILSGKDWRVASMCGNIGAGIAIEQVGMPSFEKEPINGDVWGGVSLKDRIKKYCSLKSQNGLDEEDIWEALVN
ncbi:hypothetical protein WICPIJ_007563 [Wickerhamomyces pijperi]|uniref:Carbohydrate kinase PfkB domain-containing protein n=1 Tax=Wickerhamomyces pijperi TaxID=599730 RepID=A0A9P8TJU6_WICPI|nr:hypothetical protein WICPIJ_007563 [Wickerhamomyces pijperi]